MSKPKPSPKAAKPHWKDEPEEHDYPAALEYLSLTMTREQAAGAVARIKRSDIRRYKAKDLLRASGEQPLSPKRSVHVQADLAKIAAGERLSPVLLLRSGGWLVIADGYHRICASYHLDENAEIPCRIG